MANGKEAGQANFEKFLAWSQLKTDQDWRDLAVRGSLSRTDIAAECCFAKSALQQNPRIRQALKELEESLRERGVLPKKIEHQGIAVVATAPNPAEIARAARQDARIKRLEEENAALKAEVEQLRDRLSDYTEMAQALAETGRLPR